MRTVEPEVLDGDLECSSCSIRSLRDNDWLLELLHIVLVIDWCAKVVRIVQGEVEQGVVGV